MEKRVIVFLLLSLAIISGYEYVLKELGFAPTPPSVPENAAPPSPGQPDSTSASINEKEHSKASTDESVAGTPPSRDAQPPLTGRGATEVEIVTVETELYRAKFSSQG